MRLIDGIIYTLRIAHTTVTTFVFTSVGVGAECVTLLPPV
jgi:hypothetical protein